MKAERWDSAMQWEGDLACACQYEEGMKNNKDKAVEVSQ